MEINEHLWERLYLEHLARMFNAARGSSGVILIIYISDVLFCQYVHIVLRLS